MISQRYTVQFCFHNQFKKRSIILFSQLIQEVQCNSVLTTRPRNSVQFCLHDQTKIYNVILFSQSKKYVVILFSQSIHEIQCNCVLTIQDIQCNSVLTILFILFNRHLINQPRIAVQFCLHNQSKIYSLILSWQCTWIYQTGHTDQSVTSHWLGRIDTVCDLTERYQGSLSSLIASFPFFLT